MISLPFLKYKEGSFFRSFRSCIVVCLLLVITSSCKKFLATYSQNQTFIQTAADLDELLIGQCYIDGTTPPAWVDLMDDDAEENFPISNGFSVFTYFGLHQWQLFPFTQSDGSIQTDYQYAAYYKSISALNTVLFNIAPVLEKGEPADVLRRISGEAHFLRAYYYFILSNIYGKPYRSSGSASDYGVPLKTDPAVEEKFFTRASAKEVYDQIVSDLLMAEQDLEGFNEQSTLRANQAAAQTLLSRLYLYMEDYENAIVFANKVIAKKYRLIDLNNFVPGSNFLARASPETIFTFPSAGVSNSILMQSAAIASSDNYQVSASLINTFDSADLRKQIFFEFTPDGEFLTRKGGAVPDVIEEYIIRLPEVYLNKAEALAILGRDEEAVNTLRELRKNRFRTADLSNISETGETLVNFVREDRRRELCFEFQRWFDLRRYGVNSKYPFVKIIRHRSYAYNGSGRYIQGYYELKTYQEDEAAYVLPIPKLEIEFNQGF